MKQLLQYYCVHFTSLDFVTATLYKNCTKQFPSLEERASSNDSAIYFGILTIYFLLSHNAMQIGATLHVEHFAIHR